MNKTYYEKIMSNKLFEDIYSPVIERLQPYLDNVLSLQEFHNYFKKLFPGLNKQLYELAISQNNKEGYSSSMNILYQFCYFYKNNKTIYKISDNLVNSLIVTDLKKISTEFIKIPKNNIYLSFSNELFTIEDPRTGQHKVFGAFITQEKDDDIYRHWRVLICGETNQNSENELDDSIFFYRIKFPKNKIIENKFNDMFELEGEHVFDNEIYLKQVKETLSFIANIIVYLNTDKIDLNKTERQTVPLCTAKKDKKIRLWKKKYGNISTLKYHPIGDDIENIFKDKKPSGNNIAERVYYKDKWLVRAYWQHYHIGPERLETIIKYIAPRWNMRRSKKIHRNNRS